jgi:hypothetical protein
MNPHISNAIVSNVTGTIYRFKRKPYFAYEFGAFQMRETSSGSVKM